MAVYTINAGSFGSYYQYVGANGTNDTVNIVVGPGFFGTIAVDSLSSDGEIDSITLTLPAGWYVELTGATDFAGEDPPYKDHSYVIYNSVGNSVGTMSLRANYITVPCFAAGTRIATPVRGPVRVERLAVGDRVMTLDGGALPIRWIGARVVPRHVVAGSERYRPVRIAAGSLGPGLPVRDLLVSQQHRVLLRTPISGTSSPAEVLVPAKHLVGSPGIAIDPAPRQVIYYHLLLDHHELLWSNGALTESLYTGEQALRSLGRAAVSELRSLRPELRDPARPAPRPARPLLTGAETRSLVAALARAGLPLVSPPPLKLRRAIPA